MNSSQDLPILWPFPIAEQLSNVLTTVSSIFYQKFGVNINPPFCFLYTEMFKFLVLIATLCTVSAFVNVAPATRLSSSRMSMLAAKDMAGVTAPLGFFDPLGFSKGADAATLSKYRESELKHGRTAMLAVLGWLTQERFHPFYNGKLSSNPLKAFTECPPIGFVQIIAFIGLLEYVMRIN